MTLTFGKILKPFFRLSADAFPKLAAARYGQHEDMDKTWLTFEPVARNLVGGFQTSADIEQPIVSRSGPIDERFEALLPGTKTIEQHESHPDTFISNSAPFDINRVQARYKHLKATIIKC